MFGKEYATYLDMLTHSFEQMNHAYEKKSPKNNKSSFVLEQLMQVYIYFFGIPEIGFQIRSLYFRNILTKIPPKGIKNILDAGSGIGAYTFWLGRLFTKANVTGGDIDKIKIEMTQSLQKVNNTANVSFTYFNVLTPQKKSQYDLITVIDVLEHIKNYKLALRNFYKILRKNGYLYIHVPQPNQKRLIPALKKWHHEDHIHEGLDPFVLKTILEEIGFTVITQKETFGFFGKLAWELNHLTLSKNFIIAGTMFPFLYLISLLDTIKTNKHGLGVAILVQKK